MLILCTNLSAKFRLTFFVKLLVLPSIPIIYLSSNAHTIIYLSSFTSAKRFCFFLLYFFGLHAITYRNQVTSNIYFQFASDAYYVAPVSLSAHLHASAGSRVYMYVNHYNISTGYVHESDRAFPYWIGKELDFY